MNRRLIGAVAAIVFATVGTVALVAFVRGAEDRALAGERLVKVLVVKDRIAAGTPAKEIAGDVSTERVPTKVRAEDAVTSLDALTGKVTSVDLLPGEQLTAARFVEPDIFERRRAQVDVPEDLLEVTIGLDPERAVGGVLRPGSTVGVLASFEPFEISSTEPVQLEGLSIPQEGKTPNSTHLILHKVLVTNVQTDTEFTPGLNEEGQATAPAPQGRLLVTLALEAPSIERVVFAAEHGTVWLALEPEEADEGGTRVQTRGTVYQ